VYAIATDKEATTTTVDVYGLTPSRDQSTIGAYRRQIVDGLFSGLLSGRFDEMSQKPGAPFLGAGANHGSFVRTEEASTLNALVKDDGVEAGLDALFSEAERVTRSGFTATEFDREKKVVLAGIDQSAGEKDKQPSASLAAEYIRNFLTGEPIPGIAYEAELYHRFLPEITLSEINALAKDWTPDRNRAVVISGPQKAGLTLPDETRLAAVMKAAAAKDLKPYVDTGDTQPLLDPLPAPGLVLRETLANAFGITLWELSNGVKVVLKPTTFKEDEILFRAVGLGGTSLASDKDFIAANTATQVISAGGLGKFSGVDLPKQLAGKVASVEPFIGDTDQGLSGNASRKDLETMFQLLYLTVTAPRADPTIFGVITSQTKTMLANETASPDFAFSDALIGALTQNHPRARLMTPAIVDEMDLDKSLMFYKDRFADASSLTFTFVGSFDLPTMKPLVERYLGALPTLHRNQSFRDTGPHPPKGIVERKVEKGIDPKSEAAIVFTGPFQYNQVERVAIRAMAQVMENRLREVLREALGGTYSVSVSPSYDKFPREQYTLGIEFGCDPKRTDDLVKTVFDQIALLKTQGPTEQQVADVKASLLRDVETNFKQNGYLLQQISLRYEFGEPLDSLFAISDYYNKLTPAMVQDAAKIYFNTDNYVKVTLFPEKKH
jgi:zinc protease